MSEESHKIFNHLSQAFSPPHADTSHNLGDRSLLPTPELFLAVPFLIHSTMLIFIDYFGHLFC
ncbi:MAG: hypothetical protein AAF378_25155 [Cyanobacteria bacterium P01_A01_bin.84]